MNTSRNNARKSFEDNFNEAVPPQVPHNPQVSIEEGAMSNVDIRSAIHILTQVLATQVSRDARVQVNSNVNTNASRISDFTRMNSPTFYGSKVEEDPEGFIDEVFDALDVMGVSSKKDSRVKMNTFVMGIYYLVVNQCTSAMLIPIIEISCLVVPAEQIEEQKLKQVGRHLKNVITQDGNSYKNKFEVQDEPRFKRRFSNQVLPNAPRFNKSKMSTLKPQEGKGGGSYVEKPLCSKCSRKHDSKFLVGTGNCYGCGKSGHMKRDYPMMMSQRRENAQAQASAPNPDAPKKNLFYALQSQGDQESSSDVVTSVLQLFSVDVYALLDAGREIDFDIDILPDIQPISIPAYRISPTKLNELKAQLKDMLGKGFIQPSISLWGAKVLFVKKKDV
ncbi:uncharacterized protein [Solanum lycopersicum]|uniref:uncharacterized protein n=1 Tax=Solanum lycopersicum TaxID=4081 RepID=UPI0037493981